MTNFNPAKPYNQLPLFPPNVEIKSKAILKKCVTTGAALAELKQAGRLINPNDIFNGGGSGVGSGSGGGSYPGVNLPGRSSPGSPFPLPSDLLPIPDSFFDRMRKLRDKIKENDQKQESTFGGPREKGKRTPPCN